MRLVSWNVNSLRARENQVFDWIEKHKPDVVCLQETKVTDQEFPEDSFGDLNYDVVFHGQPSYNGVCIASKDELTHVARGFPEDPKATETRLIGATIEGVRVWNAYCPNGQSVGSEKYAYKLKWFDGLTKTLEQGLASDTPLLICGDFNIAPHDIDVYDPVGWKDSILVSGPEREKFETLLKLGLVDSFRHLHPEPHQYSWWDYRTGAFAKNAGLRIDHVLVNAKLLDRVTKVWIDAKARGEDKASDHAPVIIEWA